MVAVAITVTVGGALFAVSRNAAKTVVMTQDQTIAANLAQGLLEQARGIRDRSPIVLRDNNIFQAKLDTISQTSVSVNNYAYSRDIMVDDCVYDSSGNLNTGIGNYCTVIATIRWNNPQLGEQTYQATELLTDWQ